MKMIMVMMMLMMLCSILGVSLGAEVPSLMEDEGPKIASQSSTTSTMWVEVNLLSKKLKSMWGGASQGLLCFCLFQTHYWVLKHVRKFHILFMIYTLCNVILHRQIVMYAIWSISVFLSRFTPFWWKFKTIKICVWKQKVNIKCENRLLGILGVAVVMN